MSSLLCETVAGDTMAELVAARDAATADMVELRLDGVRDLDVERAVADRPVPVIATCRPVWEGGRFSESEEERGAILARALAAGADYVDVEWKALRQGDGRRLVTLVDGNRSKVIVSSHDFDGVPADLRADARSMRATGAAVIKIAAMAHRLCDTLPLREIASGGDAVVIGMGDAGVPSRLLAARFGSRWTYGGHAVAPGQMPAARMLEHFRFRSVSDRTLLYGIAGDKVLQSPVPAMHNAAFAAAGLDAVCVPLPAADFTDFLAFTDALRISGWEASNGAADRTVDEDLPALIAAAEHQFESWTGRRPAPGVMREAAARCT
jgi:3-dehydroquinate dehydratase type I